MYVGLVLSEQNTFKTRGSTQTEDNEFVSKELNLPFSYALQDLSLSLFLHFFKKLWQHS